MKKYKVTFQEKGVVKSIVISTSDIKKENLPSNIIKVKPLGTTFFEKNRRVKVKSSEVANVFFELNIILQANIPIFEAIQMLENSTKNQFLKEILRQMKEALQNGKPIYKALQAYEKHLGKTVVSFFKIAQENGSLKDCVYSLSILLKSIENNKKLIKKKLSYPLVLFVSLMFSLTTIFNFVIPQFEYIFAQYNTSLPFATVALLGLKNFVLNYFIYVFLCIVLAGLFISTQYKKSNAFRYKVDKMVITKLPILGDMIFTNYFHRFFLSLKILLDANYKFQSSIINSSILLNNQYLLDKITTLNKRIQSGDTISTAFEDADLFDELTLRLISTGEKSNALHLSVNEIEKIYKQKLDEKIKFFSSVIEPAFIVIIMALIVWVVLAVLVPLWGIGEVIKV